jgi:uncharacterized ion transporter superfamily protein YfcC
MIVIVIAAIVTWLLPAGKYNTLSYKNGNSFIIDTKDGEVQVRFTQKTADSLGIRINLESFENGDISKPVPIPGTYHRLEQNPQSIINILQAPLRGIYEAIEIILFLLMIGSFIKIFSASGAIEKGIVRLSYKMKGRETWLIIALSFLFIMGGSTYGMDAEAMAFYPILVPVFLAAGYDLLIPVAVIFLGTQIGQLSSVTNPFSTVIASNAAGVNWISGMAERVIMLFVSSAVSIYYIVRYAQKVKKNPSASLVFKIDGKVKSPFPFITQQEDNTPLNTKTILLLSLFALTFITMITGVIFFDWWLLEMSTVFLASSIIVGIILRLPEKIFIEKFIKGAADLVGVSFIIGVARGVTIMLNDGKISDSIIYYSSQMVAGMTPGLFIVMLLILYIVFTIFISSTSGMAVVTMPIIGSLAVVIGIQGKDIVNAYLYGMGIMNIISPTGLILPALALVNVSYNAWLKFVFPLMLILTVICALFLIAGVLW